jgi:hypothetical protein
MKTKRVPVGFPRFIVLTGLILILSSCNPVPTAEPEASVVPEATAEPAVAPTNTTAPVLTPTPAPTSIPLPAFSLKPGDFYFSTNNMPGMVYTRNVAVMFYEDFDTLLDWSAAGGTKVIRFGLTNYAGIGGYPYTNTGELNVTVVLKWEKLLDNAEKHGIYVLPFFTGWADLNTTGTSDWANNPINAAKGGPAQKPTDLFREGTAASAAWFKYVTALVTRWQARRNILAWEVLAESNLIQGITEQQGIAFVEKMAAEIHAAESSPRPITASLGAQEIQAWPNFYKSKAIDITQTHPYPTNLDRSLVDIAHTYRTRYNKPVLIGESGLNWEKPDVLVTSAPNAQRGIEHAIWAGVVSGMMNARSLFWEDSYAIYFPTMRSLWLNRYAEAELPAARFTQGVDFSNFEPLGVKYPAGTKIWGAALGNARMAIGWFRDAASEPPSWNLQPSLKGQTVTTTLPGTSQNWQADFYDTKTGDPLGGSVLLTRQGGGVTVPLPDFSDDIAFKLFVNDTGAIIPPKASPPALPDVALTSTDPAAGLWEGTVFGEGTDFMAIAKITVLPGCATGGKCGTSAFDWCSNDLALKKISGDTLTFSDLQGSASASCAAGGSDTFQLQPDGTVLFRHDAGPAGEETYSGILHRK